MGNTATSVVCLSVCLSALVISDFPSAERLNREILSFRFLNTNSIDETTKLFSRGLICLWSVGIFTRHAFCGGADC